MPGPPSDGPSSPTSTLPCLPALLSNSSIVIPFQMSANSLSLSSYFFFPPSSLFDSSFEWIFSCRHEYFKLNQRQSVYPRKKKGTASSFYFLPCPDVRETITRCNIQLVNLVTIRSKSCTPGNRAIKMFITTTLEIGRAHV